MRTSPDRRNHKYHARLWQKDGYWYYTINVVPGVNADPLAVRMAAINGALTVSHGGDKSYEVARQMMHEAAQRIYDEDRSVEEYYFG